MNKNSKIQNHQKLANKLVCNFITKTILYSLAEGEKKESQNKYAHHINISSSVLTKMKREEGYEIPLSTIYSICKKENLNLSEFFKKVEEMFPEIKIRD